MRNRKIKCHYILCLAFILVFFMPLLLPAKMAFAAECSCSDGTGQSIDGSCDRNVCDVVCPDGIANCVDVQPSCISDDNGYCLEVPLPAPFPEKIVGPAHYISYIIIFSLAVVGFIAVGVIVYAGSVFIFSAGNAARVADAKDRVLKAIIGLILVFGAWIFLRAINPDFLTLTNPDLENPPKSPAFKAIMKEFTGFRDQGDTCWSNYECKGDLTCRPTYAGNPDINPFTTDISLKSQCHPIATEKCSGYCDDDDDCGPGLECKRTFSCLWAKSCMPIE